METNIPCKELNEAFNRAVGSLGKILTKKEIEELKKILTLKNVGTTKKTEEFINKVIKEIESGSFLDIKKKKQLVKYLEGISSLTHASFLVSNDLIGTERYILQDRLTRDFISKLSNIKTKEDLAKIIKSKDKFLSYKEEIDIILSDIPNKDLPHINIKSYLYNILLQAKISNNRGQSAFSAMLKYINSNEVIDGWAKKRLKNVITNIYKDIDELKDLPLNIGSKGEFDVSLKELEGKDFSEIKDNISKLIDEYKANNIANTLRSVEFNVAGTNKFKKLNGVLKDLGIKGIDKLNRRKKVVDAAMKDNPSKSMLEGLDKFENNLVLKDVASRLSIEKYGFNLDIPISNQPGAIKNMFEDIFPGKHIEIGQVFKGKILEIKVDGKPFLISVKNINDIPGILNKISEEGFIGTVDANGVPISTKSGYEKILKAKDALKNMTMDDEQLAITNNINRYYDNYISEIKGIGQKAQIIMGKGLQLTWFKYVQGFLANQENIQENAPDLVRALKENNLVQDSAQNVNGIGGQLEKILKVVEDNKDKLVDNMGSILLKANKDIPLKGYDLNNVEDIAKINTIYKDKGVDGLVNIIDDTDFVSEVGVNKLPPTQQFKDFIEHIDHSKSFNENGTLAYLLYKAGENGYSDNIIDKVIEEANKYMDNITNLLLTTIHEFDGLTNIENKTRKVLADKLNERRSFVLLNTRLSSTFDIPNTILSSGKKTYIDIKLKEANYPESEIKRLKEDLTGKSLYNSLFGKGYQKLRELMYLTTLSWLSPKAYTMTAMNFVSSSAEAYAKYGTDTNQYEGFLRVMDLMKKYNPELYKEVNQGGEFKEVFDNIFQSSHNKHTDTDISILDKISSVMAKKLNTVSNGKIAIKGDKIASALGGPLAFGDKALELMGLNKMIFNKIVNESNISMKEFHIALNEINNYDKLYKKAKTVEEQSTAYENKKIYVKKLTTFLNTLKSEATFEYQKFYKMARQQGLSRNRLSRWYFLNFFSSWGSKKMTEYINGILLHPIQTALFATKFEGPANKVLTFTKVLGDELLKSDELRVLARQIAIGGRGLWELNKGDDNNDIDVKTGLEQFTIAYQSAVSNIIGRAIMGAYGGYKKGQEQGEGIGMSLYGGAVNGLYNIAASSLREPKTLIGPLLNALVQGAKEDNMSIDNLSNIFWDSYQESFHKTFYLNSMYNMSDKYAGIEYSRPDSFTGYPIMETLMGMNFTKYSEAKEKLTDTKYLLDIFEKPTEAFNKLGGAVFGQYWGLGVGYKKDELMKQLNKDTKFIKLRNNADMSVFNQKQLLDTYGLAMKAGLLGSWDRSKKGASEQAAKVELVRNELKEKGWDIDTYMQAVVEGFRGNAERQKQIAVLGLSKAHQAVIISAYIREQAYQIGKQEAKMLGVRHISTERQNEIKANLMAQYGKILAQVDNSFHANLLNYYVKDNYKETPYAKYINNKHIKDYMQLRLLAEVADKGQIDYSPSNFSNMSAAILKDIPEEKKPKVIADYFDDIDGFNFISDKAKMVVKAGILYANRNSIRALMKSDYANKFTEAADKLADIIWNTNTKIQNEPDLLNYINGSLGHSGTGRKSKLKTVKGETIPKGTAYKVNKAINELANQIVKLPRFKDIPLKSVMRKIDLKLQSINNITLPNRELPTIKEVKQKIQSLHTKALKTDELKVKKARPQHKRIKKPRVKPVSSKSN